ncbi:hypothetical protein [Pseudolysinimonas yzui]|uniref:Uncharacterized protein n=1 Tax=Pseudolysinimonas yzui TaxID=2708254 RepID=A0A8J3GQI4_9MICO|nr:hypothetical protein [Pseudolysinimonas yzui]GHF14669.1 hypothetical protein GCM10011600_14520 [Pseudolysinimonas yzui]
MKKFFAALMVVAVIGGFAYLNWDRVGPIVGPYLGIEPEAGPTTPPEAFLLPPAPDPRYRFVLLDPSTSTDTSFRESMKALLISVVEGYLPPKPEDTRPGVPEIVGLELTVRLVATDSLAYGQPNYTVSIPSVPALSARADMTEEGALDADGTYDTWVESEASWSEAYDAAVAAAADAVAAMQSINVNTDESSGITAGAAALTLLAPAEGDVQYAVLSDLADNRPVQAATFAGRPVICIQPDAVGSRANWDALFNDFAAWAAAGGAGPVTHVRPELAAATLTTFLTGA